MLLVVPCMDEWIDFIFVNVVGILGDGRSQRSKRTTACKRTRILINERLLYEGGCARATTRVEE